MPSISASAYGTLRTCPRLYLYQNVLHLERVKQEGARPFGTLYHRGLEEWWRHAGEGDAPWANTDEALVVALHAIHEASLGGEVDVYQKACADAMMIAYHARWHQLVFERIGEGVEVSFKVPLLDPDGHEVKGWSQIGRKDAIVKFQDRHRTSVCEHKTTSSDITYGSSYWERVKLDTQSSMYIDAARAGGFDSAEVIYDVSRKPDISPERMTPEDKREYTKGRGCKTCGGSAGGKAGIKQGTGKIPNSSADLPELTCDECDGTGWKKYANGVPESPRLYAKMRLDDEKPEDYARRVTEEIAKMPEAHFKQVSVQRDDDAIAEARADLVAATVEIDSFYARARAKGNGDLTSVEARRCFPRNTGTCMHIYGRRCDFVDVCANHVDPMQSQLYRIRPRPMKAGV